jgi:uncharacterized surface protein with fasciclin (FAS1) repeats
MKLMNRGGLAAAALSATVLLAGCAGGGGEGAAAEEGQGGGGQQSTQPSESMSPSESMDSGADMDPMANLVGPACDDYAKAVPDGAGSVQGMAQDPVAVAASNNPMLKTLTQAVSGQLNPRVDLVDTLNGGEFTVFAPVDDAFAQVPKKTLTQLSKPANADMLTSILTYHVVEGQMSPQQVTGQQTTVQGEPVEVSGSGNNLTVNDASVVCGGVQTANATVYLIDGVLMPPNMG